MRGCNLDRPATVMTFPNSTRVTPRPEKVPAAPTAGSAAAPAEGAPPLAWRPESGWRDLLSGRQPDVILGRLLDGDPLRLRGLVARAVRGGAYFLDADRIHLRALARIAHDVTIDGPPADGTWVQGHVAGALEDVLRLERRAITSGEDGGEDRDPGMKTLSALAVPLGLTGHDLRVACDTFNRRPAADRRSFFALFVERHSLDDAARSCALSPTELARSARVALDAVLVAVAKTPRQGADQATGRATEPLTSGRER